MGLLIAYIISVAVVCLVLWLFHLDNKDDPYKPTRIEKFALVFMILCPIANLLVITSILETAQSPKR